MHYGDSKQPVGYVDVEDLVLVTLEGFRDTWRNPEDASRPEPFVAINENIPVAIFVNQHRLTNGARVSALGKKDALVRHMKSGE